MITRDLATRGLNRRRVLAAAARLLDIGFFRIGGERYAEVNGSYGLATVSRDQMSIRRGGVVVFDYPAKSGQQRVQAVADPQVVRVLRELRRRREPGEPLLAYYERPRWRPVRSADINDYLHELMGEDVTAKDFRTWHATVLAAVSLAVAEPAATTATGRKRAEAQAMREVARYLGNTPAVSRSAYVNPSVVEAYEDGETISAVLHRLGDVGPGELATTGPVEQAVLRLLDRR